MDTGTAVVQFAWIGWVVLIVLFLVIEILTLDLIFLMLAVGSAAALVLDLFGAPVWLQVVAAAAVSILLLLFLRPPLLHRLRRGEDTTPSNIDALLGMSGAVVSTVDAASGQVKLANGDVWTARSDDPASLPPGTTVRVVRIEGATAIVRREESSS
ncbi:NfeD family protein [Microbacterium sp. X-17]|uniref:NfeD family protein n=1 Tax=Microbacterium sp. X-17 TaxID=3144404 RepID=UPI0031F551E9